MKLMKILYLINSLKNGGPVNMLYTLIKYIDKKECEVVVIALKKAPENNYRDFSTLDCKVYTIGSENIRNCINEAQKIIDLEKPDIIHSHGGMADWINTKVNGQHKRFSTVHCAPDEDFSMKHGAIWGWLKASAFIHVMKKIDTPIACSKTVADKIRKKRHYDIGYIRNGVDLNKRNSTEDLFSREKLAVNEEDIILVFCGYLSLRKNVKYICEMLSLVERKDIKFIVLGDGMEYESILEFAKQDNRIKALGRVENAYKYLRVCDYIISASKSEGLPLAVMEGMACGLPALLSDIDSHRELGECCPNGIELFSISESEQILDLLEKLTKPTEQERKNAKKVIDEYLNAERMAGEYCKVYKNKLTAKV